MQGVITFQGTPAAHVRVVLDRLGAWTETDAAGRFNLGPVRVARVCTLVTIRLAYGDEVRLIVDNPFYAGDDHTLDYELDRADHEGVVGPPLSQGGLRADDPARCARQD
jgi:hypothetical protein